MAKKKMGLSTAERVRLLDEQNAAAERARAEAAARAEEEARRAAAAARRSAHAARVAADREAAERRRAAKKKRPRFVRTEAEKREKPAPMMAAPPQRGATFAARLMTKNLALPPKPPPETGSGRPAGA